MKKVLTLFLVLTSVIAADAQVKKTTGGCNFQISLGAISPGGWDYILYNHQPYTVKGTVNATGCEGAQGKVDVKLGGVLMGSQVNSTDWDFAYEVPILFDHLSGTQSLEVIFTAEGSSGCSGNWKTQMNVTIKDSVKTDSLKTDSIRTCDSIAVKPPKGSELIIYPVPASGSISINGLRPTETSWVVAVTNADGRPVPMPAGKLVNGIISISTLHLPQGRYYLYFQTRERSVGGTIEILR